MLDGPDFTKFKIGEWQERSIDGMVKYFGTRLPSKVNQIEYVHPCYITITDTEEFQYKTDKHGVNFAYGFDGTGFKFFPLHGKIVYDGLLKKADFTYVPKKFQAKL